MFDSSVQQYQEALKSSGYDHKLQFEEQDVEQMNKKKNKRKRYKDDFWINPPYSMNVATKVGAEIFKALETEIGPNNPLHKTFNKHTVRLSYACMPNMQKKVSIHNSKIYNDKQQNDQQVNNQVKPCNCRGGRVNCPLGGKCNIEKSVVYSCKVTRLDDFSTETYTGMTKDTFKERLYGHNFDFRHRKQESSTRLSSYIWHLKDQHVQYRLEWKIIRKAKSYNPVTGNCRLCLLEKYCIMYNWKDATLNSRDEIFVPCRHKKSFLLSKTKT